MTEQQTKYQAVDGLNALDGTRYEPGDPIPASLVKASPWLVSSGHVAELDKKGKPKIVAAPEPPAEPVDGGTSEAPAEAAEDPAVEEVVEEAPVEDAPESEG